METADYQDALNIDMNNLNRMPVRALHILDEDEMKTLMEKQMMYSFLDSFIMFACVVMAIVSPIEKHNIPDCKTDRWEAWCFTELCLATISLILDQITYRQVKNQYVSAWTTFVGFVVDFLQISMLGWLMIAVY